MVVDAIITKHAILSEGHHVERLYGAIFEVCMDSRLCSYNNCSQMGTTIGLPLGSYVHSHVDIYMYIH